MIRIELAEQCMVRAATACQGQAAALAGALVERGL
jgi:hypothetical protein